MIQQIRSHYQKTHNKFITEPNFMNVFVTKRDFSYIVLSTDFNILVYSI